MAGTLLLVLCALAMHAQDGNRHRVQLVYDNDYFRATDYYFTQGIALEYQRDNRHYRLVQEGYTPTSIRDDQIRYGDRPYAGALYLSYGLNIQPAARGCGRIPGGETWGWAIDLGLTGPPSLAAAEQKWIHRQTGNLEPMGWRYQIATDLILNGRLHYSRRIIEAKYLRVAGKASVDLGTYRSRGELSLPVNLGRMHAKHGTIGLSFYLNPAIRLVGYDATLQGGAFTRGSSPYVLHAREVERLVGLLNYGVKLNFYGLGIDFSYTDIGREFNSGAAHAWGTVRLTYAWGDL